MGTMYAVCAPGAYDAESDVCAQITYVDEVPSWVPELSREDGAVLGGAIFVLLFTAWAYRFLRSKPF